MKKYGKIKAMIKNVTLLVFAVTFIQGMQQESIPQGLEQRIEQIRKDWDIPGMAVAIIKGDKVIYANGFGVRELGKSAKVDEKTLFAVGSTTKAMTVATLGMLVDEKKLSWDDRVVDILPGFRMYDAYATAEMRVRDLLTHKSGLTRGDQIWYAASTTQEEVLHGIRYLKPAYSFRSTYNYQNLMYLTAGMLSGKIHGDSWDNVVSKRIFKPLKMRTSVTNLKDLAKRKNVASPHADVDGELQPIEDRNLENISPAGSVYSNALEMANWVKLNMKKGEFEGKRIVSEVAMNEMHKPQMHASYSSTSELTNFRMYGLGWSVDDYRGHKRVSHGGGIDGFRTWLGFIPDIKLGWVVFNNGGSGASTLIGYEIIDAFLGLEDDVDWSAKGKKSYAMQTARADSLRTDVDSRRVMGTQPRLESSGYKGDYHDDFYGNMTVTASDGKIILSRGNALRGTLNHWHYDTFRVRWDSPRERASFGNEFITFHFNAKNEAHIMERFLDGNPVYFNKVKDDK
jgi:CubicO group peptidase (beta-lactamase class C family)|tara:strand:+ start:10331 stop:11866 length:1536 start_codon:yes stop_codon:yes gene_type:complete